MSALSSQLRSPLRSLASHLRRGAAQRCPARVLLSLSASLALAACGSADDETVGLSAGSACEGAAPAMCSPECAPVCAAGAWQCECGESSDTSGDDATTTTDASSSSGGVSASSGDASTTDDSATSGSTSSTSGAASTTDDTDATGDSGTTDDTGTTTGDDSTSSSSSSTSGDDTSTGSTTEDPWDELQHVHIDIDNFCKVSVDPPEIHVPVDATVKLSYHNHSVDYKADVWLSYGGGYLELELGNTWDDPFEWCTGPNASTGYADISIAGGGNNACPKHRMKIYCE